MRKGSVQGIGNIRFRKTGQHRLSGLIITDDLRPGDSGHLTGKGLVPVDLLQQNKIGIRLVFAMLQRNNRLEAQHERSSLAMSELRKLL